MARLEVDGDHVVVRLNLVERLAALRWRPRCPVASVVSVKVLPSTPPGLVDSIADFGFAAQTAPGRSLATVGPRAKAADGRPALVVTYRAGKAVLIRFGNDARWALFLVSSRQAEQVAERIRSAVTALDG